MFIKSEEKCQIDDCDTDYDQATEEAFKAVAQVLLLNEATQIWPSDLIDQNIRPFRTRAKLNLNIFGPETKLKS